MNQPHVATPPRLVHIVTLSCKDENHAERCIAALANHGKPDAMAYGCVAYEYGLQQGSLDTVCLVERWTRWDDLDRLLAEKVVPALPLYNALLKQPFNPERDTVRIQVSDA